MCATTCWDSRRFSTDTVAYTGGGFAGGMFYTSYGVSKYGQTTYTYYEIDEYYIVRLEW